MACLHLNINPDRGSCADCGYCLHEVVFGGLCALCGTIVNEDDENNNTGGHIDMTHDASGITVSKKEAERIQKQDEARLLKARKLSLIVDLDQTILHAAWEPHIAEWVDNHKQKGDSRAKDMSTFTLDGSKYTIKLRPGTIQFLKDMSKLYEMHVYTMGTRAYAKAVAAVIDPSMELFQDRILTRDENGSLTKKRLDRLFPTDQSKVVVLDDRADVWDYSPNLIQIKPYEYFAGVGDINAPPNAQSTNLIPTETVKNDVNTSDVNTSDVNTADVNTSDVNTADINTPDVNTADVNTSDVNTSDVNTSDVNTADVNTSDVNTTDVNNDERNKSDEANITVNNKEQAEIKESHSTEPQSPSTQSEKDKDITPTPSIEIASQDNPTNSILASFNPQHEDTDRILSVINKALTDVHDEFYRLVDEGEPKPHIATVLPDIKQNVLKNCTLVFSGVIPLQQRAQDASIWKMAVAFGANCLEELTGKVTHLVTANAGTSKVNTARKYQQIKIVSPRWLMNSMWNFKKENETPYLIPVEDISSSEVENPEEASLEYEEEEPEIEMDWSDSEIDELLADDTGTEGARTPAPASSLGVGSVSDVSDIYDLLNGNGSDGEPEELEDADWLGKALDGMDDSDGEGDYGDVESVASSSSESSSSSKKRQRDFDNDEKEDELSFSKKQK